MSPQLTTFLGQVVDDRSQHRPLFDLATPGLAEDVLSAVDREDLLGRAHSGRSRRFLIGVAVGSTLLLIGVVALVAAWKTRGLSALVWIVPAVALYFGVNFLRTVVRERRPGAIREAMLWKRRCASCAYPLESIRPEADGCTVCPEFAAAWRLPPMHAEKALPGE